MASITGKTDAVVAWAKGWPELDGYLKLNAVSTEAGEHAINTVPSGSSVYNDIGIVEYVDGTAKREYTFALVMIADWSDGFDNVNAEANRLGESWVDWVASQYPDNVPDFGDKTSISKIEPLYNMPSLAMVYQEDSLAKYMFQAKITYTE